MASALLSSAMSDRINWDPAIRDPITARQAHTIPSLPARYRLTLIYIILCNRLYGGDWWRPPEAHSLFVICYSLFIVVVVVVYFREGKSFSRFDSIRIVSTRFDAIRFVLKQPMRERNKQKKRKETVNSASKSLYVSRWASVINDLYGLLVYCLLGACKLQRIDLNSTLQTTDCEEKCGKKMLCH